MTMYTITLRFGDLAAATQAVLHIAAEFPGFDVSFGPDYVEVVEPDRLAKARDMMMSGFSATRVPGVYGDPSIVKISDKARRNVSAANRMAKPSTRVADNIEHTHDIWMAVPCPYCQTNPGRPCVTPTGRDTGTHGARATLYRQTVSFPCLICGANYYESSDLEWHMVDKHGPEAVPVDQGCVFPAVTLEEM
jgi:hypothetical protein